VTHAFITVAIPFAGEHVQEVNESLRALGNPPRADIAAALNKAAFVHFISITVHTEGESSAYLILEASADGDARVACARLALTVGPQIADVLWAAGLKIPKRLDVYLEKHRLDVGAGWFSTSGALFSGTPGMSVRRIKDEDRLASWISDWLERNRNPEPALQKLKRLRDEIFEMADLKWAFVAEPVALLGGKPPPSAAVWPLLVLLFRQLLWPLLVPPVLAAIVSRQLFGHSYLHAIWDAILAIGLEILLAGVGLGIAYLWLRRQEETDRPEDEEPNAAKVAEIMAGENIVMQNHLGGASVVKPGFVRRMILRLVFWMIGAWTTYLGAPGFLYSIGTIHFARWVILPRTNAMLFISNYDGSWESYLEDFIARAHVGLSAIWSNTRNFPKTENLIEGGASDGERFKRWARRYQRPTHFWFSAYPNLKTSRIRTNATIRHGFATAMTEEAAAQWLNSLGFPIATAPRLESGLIPTLVFGGLSPLRHAHCLIVELAGKPEASRHWLRELAGNLSYGDHVPDNSAIVVGFSATGLRKLGLAESALGTFPVAFQQGMAAPWRARALQDTGANSPDRWRWGGPHNESDAILLLYAKESARLDEEVKHSINEIEKYGHRMIHRIALATLPQKGGPPVREHFGFIDGISQPVVRGTSKWANQRVQNQVIEPGEIILGYPDNLGFCAPMPDSNGFPVGRNGTFLVARQLEQDPECFRQYIDAAAAVVAADPRSPNNNPEWLREWIAAKMVGRWREDGTSLVRHPTPPGTAGRTTVPEDNDFLFGAEDPDGLRCPFGAHIRRANPRDSFDAGSQVQIGITNRHRILRVGRAYSAEDNNWEKPGLLFMCLNADIEGQFEFLQQTWVLGRDFQGQENDADPILGQHRVACQRTMSIPTPFGPIHLPHMTEFVTVRGGGYFFMPGKRAVDFFART
jgi:deferrochelatase/peroxidase EfeB